MRDYKKEYKNYHSKPKQIKNRSSRNKARKIMKWKCILKFEETMELVANWYRNFYSSSRNTNHITNQQIENYQSLAVKRGLKWAKTN